MSKHSYDAQNPRMLSDEELSKLSTRECNELCTQLDAHILRKLEGIERSYAKSTRTVTELIIPAVEQYGRSSKKTWDSVKLWKAIFDTAAGLPLSDLAGLADSSSREADDANATQRIDQPGQHKRISTKSHKNQQGNSDDSESGEDTTVLGICNIPSGNGQTSEQWQDETSPFDKLQRDMQSVDLAGAASMLAQPTSFAEVSASSTVQLPAVVRSQKSASPKPPVIKAVKPQTRLRDLSLDSPDFKRPSLETMSFEHPHARKQSIRQPNKYEENDAADKKGKGRESHRAPVQYDDYRNHEGNPPGFFREGSEAPSSIGFASFDSSSIEHAAEARHGSARSASGQVSLRAQMPSSSRRQSGGQRQLLHKVLERNTTHKYGRPSASTPARPRYASTTRKSIGKIDMPSDLPQGWNGIADLSQTPLSSFESPQKSTISPKHSNYLRAHTGKAARSSPSTSPRRSPMRSLQSTHTYDHSVGLHSGMQSFQAPTFSVSKSRLTKTPAKEAARLMTHDVLQRAALRAGNDMSTALLDSPVLEPPSVVKNWATRGYTTHLQSSAVHQSASHPADSPRTTIAPSPSAMLADAEDDSFEAEFDQPLVPPPQPKFSHLADSGDEVGSRHHQDDTAGDDGWGDSFEDGEEDEGASMDDPVPPIVYENGIANGVVANGDQDGSFDESRSFGDEETVFGARRASAVPHNKGAPGVQGYGATDEDGFLRPSHAMAPEDFRMKGLAAEDMVTLHGGKLLESQPFEASPLAGRDVKYGL